MSVSAGLLMAIDKNKLRHHTRKCYELLTEITNVEGNLQNLPGVYDDGVICATCGLRASSGSICCRRFVRDLKGLCMPKTRVAEYFACLQQNSLWAFPKDFTLSLLAKRLSDAESNLNHAYKGRSCPLRCSEMTRLSGLAQNMIEDIEGVDFSDDWDEF